MATGRSADAPGPRRDVVIAVVAAVVVVPLAVVGLLGASVLLRGGGAPPAVGVDLSAPASFVGIENCRACHEAEVEAWRGSHHDLAMAEANEDTVLGDFNDAVFEGGGIRARFFRRGGGFFVETGGRDGVVRAFEVEYTFGVTPLQQYLIGFPDGRYQALTIAWDTRPAGEGGQRWFHVYADERTPPGDELHWASPAHNWNFACAECHSTNLEKGYDAETDTFATTWSEIDVSCEACHGPGSRHAAIERALEDDPEAAYPADRGLVVRPSGAGEWSLPEGARNAGPVSLPPGDPEIEMCGRCHARRTQVAGYAHGEPLLDTHRVSLLDEGLYFPDGQILDEVYVYGSFAQSKMHAVGVTCSDCHEPHSLTLRAPGNALCASCHAPEAFDTPSHHFHEMGTDGASCVECHMPERTYMVVDPRRDHSMRIPRPDLSAEFGVPNACNACHDDRTARWAAESIVAWYGEGFRKGYQTFTGALHAGRLGAPGAADRLAEIARDPAVPPIARGTALRDLGAYITAGSITPDRLSEIESALGDPEAFVRLGAARAVAFADASTRWAVLSGLLDDPVRSVRLAAAGNLLDIRPETLATEDAARLRRALGEYESALAVNADRADSWVQRALLHLAQGEPGEAERDFAEARRRDPGYFAIYANEADLYRQLGREADAERVLREGLGRLPDNAALRHSLGLLLIRTGRGGEAMDELAAAHGLAPDHARFGYVYGVALRSAGRGGEAVAVWEVVLETRPYDADTLFALCTTLMDLGREAEALPHAETLAALYPENPRIDGLVRSLRGATSGDG